MNVYYDKDADLSLIRDKKVTIVGYGSQGHAHANNLSDSGVTVTVGLRKEGASWGKAEKAGLTVKEVAESVKDADVVMVRCPMSRSLPFTQPKSNPTSRKALLLPLPTASIFITARWRPGKIWTSS
jgi:ketol-acid reductoisomerase